jgi:hypothetical protein
MVKVNLEVNELSMANATGLSLARPVCYIISYTRYLCVALSTIHSSKSLVIEMLHPFTRTHSVLPVVCLQPL